MTGELQHSVLIPAVLQPFSGTCDRALECSVLRVPSCGVNNEVTLIIIIIVIPHYWVGFIWPNANQLAHVVGKEKEALGGMIHLILE